MGYYFVRVSHAERSEKSGKEEKRVPGEKEGSCFFWTILPLGVCLAAKDIRSRKPKKEENQRKGEGTKDVVRGYPLFPIIDSTQRLHSRKRMNRRQGANLSCTSL